MLEAQEENKEYFDYLIKLRDSGRINMLEASPHLARTFGLEMSEAQRILGEWIATF